MGVVYAAFAYIAWGFFPLYFDALGSVQAIQVIDHRITWSFVALAAVVLVRREGRGLLRALTPRVVGTYLLAALLLAVNWYVYVWAVQAGHVVETSLGYFINPLVSVLLGVVILRERLRPLQWLPIGLAAAGVAFLAFSYGNIPWIALALAGSFGGYGLVKKLAPLTSLYGLTIETALLFPLALVYLVATEAAGTAAFGHQGAGMDVMLMLAGPITVVPLLAFASGARRVTLTTLGLLQYFAPTLQFLIGVVVLHEAMTPVHLVGFVVIWIALALFSAEGLAARRRAGASAVGGSAGSELEAAAETPDVAALALD